MARYSHSLEFSISQSLLFVYGGKNDTQYKSTGTQEVTDIKALNLLQMVWIKIKVDGETLTYRHSHGSCLFDDKIMIFGGISSFRLVNSKPKFIEISKLLIRISFLFLFQVVLKHFQIDLPRSNLHES